MPNHEFIICRECEFIIIFQDMFQSNSMIQVILNITYVEHDSSIFKQYINIK